MRCTGVAGRFPWSLVVFLVNLGVTGVFSLLVAAFFILVELEETLSVCR